MFLSKKYVFNGLFLLSVCSSPPLFAQGTDDAITLETITVEGSLPVSRPGVNKGYVTTRSNTATGMDLSFQETPQSSSVTTKERMQDQGLHGIEEAVRSSTGLSVSNSDANRVQYWARGLPVRTIIHNGTAITWDTRFAYGDKMLDTAIYERIEVVRGANGLMQGAGTPSAAINLVRKRPTDELTAEVSAGVGSWKRRRLALDVSGPLSREGGVRGRAIYAYRGGDSWLDRADSEQNTLYGTIEADLTANTLLTLGGMYQDKDAKASMSGGLPLFYSDGSRTNFDRSVNIAPTWATYNSRIKNLFASIEHYINQDWQVKFAYDHNDSQMKQPTLWATGNPDPVTNQGMRAGSLYFIDGERKQDTVDLSIKGQFRLFDREHQLIGGIQYWKQTFSNPYYGAKAPLGLPYAGRSLNPANPALGDITRPDFAYPATAGYPAEPEWDFTKVAIGGVMNLEGETQQSSAYLASQWQLSDSLRLLLGGRIDNWKTSQTNFGTKSNYQIDSQLTPYLGLTYAVNDHFSLYGNYTSIFTPQSNLDKSGVVLKPIEGRNYEAGIKSSLMNGTLQASLAVFRMDQDNVAVADGVIPGSRVSAFRGQNGTKTEGWEAEISGAITPKWNLYAGYSYAITKDPEGKRLHTSSPKSTFKLFTTYDLSSMLNGLTVGGGVYWQGDIYRENVNSPTQGKVTVEHPGYATVDLMARYRINANASVSLNMNNVFDKKYYSQLGMYDQYFYGTPRNAMLQFNYRF